MNKFKALLFLTIIFWLASSLLHLKFSLFIVNPISTPWGELRLRDYSNHVFIAGFIVILSGLIYFLGKNPNKSIIMAWIFWLLFVVLINRYFMATPIENIHFFQYAIIAYFLLSALKHSAGDFVLSKTLFRVTAMGVIDELLQYFYITRSYSNYLDFNDFWLNMIGCIAGMLFYISRYPINKDRFNPVLLLKSLELKIISIFILCFAVIIYVFEISIERKANSYANWNPDFFSGQFYVLSPLQGSFILVFTSLIFLPFLLSFKRYESS